MSASCPDHRTHIGVALSGGGVRAAAFHAGVLRNLAERQQLEDVVHVSSVSGGSLFMGLLLHSSKYRWPSSSAYLSSVFPQVRDLLTTRSLQDRALASLVLNPRNWRFLLSRANVIAQTIPSLWGIDAPLGRLGAKPVWSINATTAETGRRFRFKAARMGDYELGYADAAAFPLAAALAVSAAFPGGIGPLAIRPRDFQWFKRSHWDATDGERLNAPPFARLHLYDGGLYDNLGIEPLFDIGSQSFKPGDPEPINHLVVSDAGAALPRRALPHILNPLRFKRIADIALDQTRALRVRTVVNFLKNHPSQGAYLQLGSNPVESINRLQSGREETARELLEQKWLQPDAISAAAMYSTTLRQMAASDFDLISQHGFETARWNYGLLGRAHV